MQLAVLFRLAVDAGTAVSYRAIAEDVWGQDAPENSKAALQSIVSRLRLQLPAASIESTAGGYRLAIARADVDALVFSDLVASAEPTAGGSELAADALRLWTGEPWIPSDNFDWFVRDLTADHAKALSIRGTTTSPRLMPDLPVQLTSLIGRDAELATIADQLANNRLVTIIGTGGAGKTRLALEAVARRRDAMLVELAPVGASEVTGAVLTATGRDLRTGETTGESSRTRILEALAGRDVLLVLDNCEHVIDAAAVLSQDLLSSLPRLRILATSREPLGVPGEAFVGLSSLAHPTDAQITESPGSELRAFPAVELFVQRALSATGRPLDDAELATAARVCSRLDGLPLAIELAAAKLRTMDAAEVLAGLDDRFTLLTGGYRTAMPRHQTLRAMIDWSWSLLDDSERRALTGLSVFPAGVSVAEARSLAAELDLPGAAVFDSMVDRSLLQRTRGRFRQLETIREYGIERLADHGVLAEARTAQARYVTKRASEIDRLLRGPRIMEAITWFDDEEDNLASALRYSSGVPLADITVGLTIACTWYWVLRDRNEEAASWLRVAAGLAGGVEGEEARALSLLHPLLLNFSGADDDEFDIIELAAQLRRLLEPMRSIELGSGRHEVFQLLGPGLVAFAEVAADPDWVNSVRIPRGEDLLLDPWPTAMLHVMRAAAAQNRGEVSVLGDESRIALALFEEVGDSWGFALSQRMRAEWLTLHGQLEEALLLADSSTNIMRAITSTPDLAREQGLSIQLLWRLGRVTEARARLAAMLTDTEISGDPRAIVQAQINALLLDAAMKDLPSADARIPLIDRLVGLSRMPQQSLAVLETGKAAVERERGDFALAESHLRLAAEYALRSRDHPVIGGVANGIAMLAMARGEIALAVRAIDFASAIIGACDATHPDLAAVSAAADDAGIGRPRTEVPERPISLEALSGLLD
ncbi:MAG: hypothetical protein JWQ43_808 [Glaciihabitans sp.]|nr:hypothetical protein [Glaciihabitans sp.]